MHSIVDITTSPFPHILMLSVTVTVAKVTHNMQVQLMRRSVLRNSRSNFMVGGQLFDILVCVGVRIEDIVGCKMDESIGCLACLVSALVFHTVQNPIWALWHVTWSSSSSDAEWHLASINLEIFTLGRHEHSHESVTYVFDPHSHTNGVNAIADHHLNEQLMNKWC